MLEIIVYSKNKKFSCKIGGSAKPPWVRAWDDYNVWAAF